MRVEWSPFKPGVFFALEQKGLLHVWDLLKSDQAERFHSFLARQYLTATAFAAARASLGRRVGFAQPGPVRSLVRRRLCNPMSCGLLIGGGVAGTVRRAPRAPYWRFRVLPLAVWMLLRSSESCPRPSLPRSRCVQQVPCGGRRAEREGVVFVVHSARALSKSFKAVICVVVCSRSTANTLGPSAAAVATEHTY